MKKHKILFFLLILSGFSTLYGGYKIKIDVKTHFKEKVKLRAVKEGVIFYLKKSGFEVVESGEDYSLWLEDYVEKRVFIDKYKVNITVKLSYPTAFFEKPPIYKIDEKISFKYSPELLDVDETGLWKYLKEKIDDIKKKDMVKSHFVGRKIAYDIYFLFREGKIKDKRFKPIKKQKIIR